MASFALDPSANSFRQVTQHAVSCVEELTRKIIIHDNEPIFEQLRRGTFVTSFSRLSEVDPLYEDSSSRLVEYDYNIAQLEEALGKLKNTRDSFKHSIDAVKSLCAPVRRLPEDVLIEIFAIYADLVGNRWSDNYSLTLYASQLPGQVPCIFSPYLELSWICSYWRKVVFERPTFWSSFSLAFSAPPNAERETELNALLSDCLSRSKDTPLDLHSQ
ncbi:hypothetical protein GYMLUDRAFT_50895 [Collybiopsis luxurians FD-317 M1]|uniref:F-box domain-containing protein n=1 Tax=Collybiopsis luxurians FD-317 M1 TaxID=944289 RepID=A0A0D0C036_9AGAR|nr:hypothetical protein GYMLUDRAFT_50895 [Collybiopsis luxurians FD-317 M1]